MALNNIEISNEAVGLIQSKIKEAFPKEIEKEEQITFTQLKNAATKMLKAINTAINLERKLNNEKRKRYLSIIQDSGIEIKHYIDQHSTSVLAGKIQFEILKFEEQLNLFLNRDIRFTLVDSETGDVFVTSKAFARDIYKNAIGSKGEFKLSSSVFKEAKNKSINLKDIKELNVNKYIDIYQLALSRFDKTVESYKNSSKPGTFIYWHNGKSRKYGFVQSRGSLAEAYVAAIYYQDKYQGSIDEMLQQWYFQRVLAVDSAQETVSGDIGEQGDILQLAVKAMGASFGSYKQWIDLAIKLSTDTLSIADEQYVQNIVNDLAKTPALINKLKDKTLEEYNKVFAGLDIVR